MPKKATIYKLPEKYLIKLDDGTIAFARSGYNAAEEAKQHGATVLEMGEWTDLFQSDTSSSRSASRSSTRQAKAR